MFQIKTNHVCTLGYSSSHSYLPPLRPQSRFYVRWQRYLKKLILITETNPESFAFYRSIAEIMDARKRQVRSGTWIIHPFSTFRLFYEMYMMVVFLISLIVVPLDAAYGYFMRNFIVLSNVLDFLCMIDIALNFCTGYKSPEKEHIVMSCGRIARHYVFGKFFICDVLAAVPKISGRPDLMDVFDYLALLKFMRMITFIQYLNRTLSFFRISTTTRSIFQLTVCGFLVLHLLTCLFPLLSRSYYLFSVSNDVEEKHLHFVLFRNVSGGFFPLYLRNLYASGSYVLSVDIDFTTDLPWSFYLVGCLAYLSGSFLLIFAQVTILDMLRTGNALETKYYAMMSEVDAFMAAKQFPIVMQKRMREYYLYKYRQIYFKETGIREFLSDKLKKEITYHACRKLVSNVQIFQHLPQDILEDVLSCLKVEVYLSNDLIIRAGTEGDCMYFVASGTVIVLSPSGKEICHLEDGDYFGEICLFLAKLKRTANVIASEICEVYKLDRRSFKKCLETNRNVYKMMQAEAKRRYLKTKEIERAFMQFGQTK